MEASGINIEFKSINSKAYDVSALTLGQGQEIILTIPSIEQDVKVFSDNDPSLELDQFEKTTTVAIKAVQVGASEIQIRDNEDSLLKKIVITTINNQATSINFGDPIIENK